MDKFDQDTIDRIIEVKRIKKIYKSGQLETAKKAIIKYLAKNPDDYYACFTAGRILENARCYDEAEKYLLKVVASESDNKYSAYGTLGRIEEDRKNIPKAISYYEKAISGPYIETYSIRALSSIYIDKHEYDKALELLSKIKDTTPDYYNFEVARIYTELKEYAKARTYLDKIPASESSFYRKVCLQKAIVNKCLFDYEKALSDLEQLLTKEDALSYKAIYEMANINFSLKNYAKAKELINNYHNNVKQKFLLGKINEVEGDIASAKENYTISVNSTSKNIKCESAFRLAEILLEEKEYDKALHYYNKAVNDHKVFPVSIYFRIVAIYIRTKRYQEAYQLMEFIKENRPSIVQEYLFRSTNTFLKNVLGMPIDKDTLCYRESMLVDYSFEKMYNHVNFYVADTKPKFINYSFSEIYTKAKKGLTNKNKVETCLLDTYDINIENVGTLDGKVTDKLRVITIPNTKLIIDMYPSFEETLKDKMKKEQEREKVKVKNKD